jgi:uncharacterized membrane protein
MFRGKGMGTVVKENALDAADLAAQLAADRKFRRQLLAAIGHGYAAQQRARSRLGLVAAARGLAGDEQLRDQLRQMSGELQAARARVERKRSHWLRNSLLILAGAGGAAAAVMPQTRRWIAARVGNLGGGAGVRPRTVQAEIEVEVPVSTAYNQWTQFEEFPKFMDGVEEVRQLDDARLHWVASVAGKRAEWDAKILEQHPDKQISWISENGKKTRGTVSFEERGPSRTRVTLSMSYQAEGVREAIGSAVGLDSRRVHQDLQRFKELIETRGSETGAWRGDISEGSPRGGKQRSAK